MKTRVESEAKPGTFSILNQMRGCLVKEYGLAGRNS